MAAFHGEWLYFNSKRQAPARPHTRNLDASLARVGEGDSPIGPLRRQGGVAWSALLSPLWLCHSRMMGDTGRKFRYASRDRACHRSNRVVRSHARTHARPALAMRLMALLFPTVMLLFPGLRLGQNRSLWVTPEEPCLSVVWFALILSPAGNVRAVAFVSRNSSSVRRVRSA